MDENFFGQSSGPQIKRIIRSLEEIEDENSSGARNSSVGEGTSGEGRAVLFSGDYYERHSETMNFRVEGFSGVGDWEGSVRDQSGDNQDDDVTDDVMHIQTHEVSAVKRTGMATAVDPREIEQYQAKYTDSNERGSRQDLAGDKRRSEVSVEESGSGEERIVEVSSSSGISSNVELLPDNVQNASSANGHGHINKTIMREIQHNLHKVWRYASPRRNLDVVAKGPKGKEEERKLQEIYNLLMKHESLGARRREPEEAVSGEGSGFSEEHSGVSIESGDELGRNQRAGSAHEKGSALEERSGEDEGKLVEIGSLSGENSTKGHSLEVPVESASGLGVKEKIRQEVERDGREKLDMASFSGESSGNRDRLDLLGESANGSGLVKNRFQQIGGDESEKVIFGNASGEGSGNDERLMSSNGSVSASNVVIEKLDKKGTHKVDYSKFHEESSGKDDASDVSTESGSGVVNRKLMNEVEHNLHSVWRYAAPKKDLDMVAKGPKGKEEERKLKEIYNLVSKHETGSAFLDFHLRRDKKLKDKTKRKHKHKSRKSLVKIFQIAHNSTESKLYRLQKARKPKNSKSLKRLKSWEIEMGKHQRRKKPEARFSKKISKMGKNANKTTVNSKLAVLRKEMNALAPGDDKEEEKTNDQNKPAKLGKNETKTNSENEATKVEQNESGAEISDKNKGKDENEVLDKQEPFDKTRLEIGKTLEELILNRMAQLEANRLKEKPVNKDSKEAVDETGPIQEEVLEGNGL